MLTKPRILDVTLLVEPRYLLYHLSLVQPKEDIDEVHQLVDTMVTLYLLARR